MQKIKRIFINIVIFVVTFLFMFTAGMIMISDASLHDVFTSSRISALKDRPENIKKDIFVDTTFLSATGGITTLTINVLKNLVHRHEDWRFIITEHEGQYQFKDFEKLSNVKIIKVSTCRSMPKIISLVEKLSSGIVRDKISQILLYGNIIFDDNVNLIWDPTGELCFIDSTIVPRVSTIHDLAWFEPNGSTFLFNFEKLKHLRWQTFEKTARVSKKIITVSNFSKKRIIEQFNLPEDRVQVIPIQLGKRVFAKYTEKEELDIMKKYNIQRQKYFIFCSTWWKNKNHKNLMLAFEKFIRDNPATKLKLLIVGQHDDFDNIDFWKIIKDETKKRMVIVGHVSDTELNIMLQNALAFIHPSIYEGFGIPLVEAMSSGIPVACSNVASLPEVVGDAAIKFNPYKVDEIASAMQKLADDENLRKLLIQKGYEQVKQYENSDAMIEQYEKVFEEYMK